MTSITQTTISEPKALSTQYFEKLSFLNPENPAFNALCAIPRLISGIALPLISLFGVLYHGFACIGYCFLGNGERSLQHFEAGCVDAARLITGGVPAALHFAVKPSSVVKEELKAEFLTAGAIAVIAMIALCALAIL